ncbi:hypothetical protein FGB62_189g043 [Gracilaria domingensis]|nr:hypothetical protein FGB62_189g043 [Gracilaria domingensis]
MRKRKRYEEQIAEKNKEGLNVIPASWKMSITETVMETMLEGRFIDADSIDDVTDDMIKACLTEKSKIAQNRIRLDHWDKIVKDVKMDMTIDDAEGRVYNLVVNYRNALRDHGYSEAITKNPEVAIKHIRERVKPRRFQEHMEGILRIESHAGLHKKDFGAYVRRLAEEADKFEYVQRNSKDVINESIMPINTHATGKRKRDGNEDQRSTRPRKEVPLCWNKAKCSGERHYINKCPKSTAEEKKAFLKKYKDSKEKRSENQSVKKVGGDEQRSSTVFDAYFCHGKLESEVTADQGASANIMPKQFYEELKKGDGVKAVHKLGRQATFDVYNKNAPPITCDWRVTADVSLEIRHGKTMMLRNVDWLVANECTSGIVIGRQLLNALGLNNRVLLTAAMSRVGADVDIPILYASTKLDLERDQDINKVMMTMMRMKST